MKKSVKAWLRPKVVALLSDSVIKYNAQNIGRPAAMPGSDPYTEARIQYLLNEVSDLQIRVRELTAPKANSHDSQAQTKESFSYQWAEIKEGLALLGDPEFEKQMVDLLSKYTDRPRDWFKGKKVLDAGCGMGRWSFVLRELGADVTAVDQSASGVAHLQSLLADKGSFRAQRADLLEPLPFGAEFDLVWCYGVTHHTGNTKLSATNVAAAVKPGGRLFLMIYGEPTNYSGFVEINTYVEHRRATQNMTFEEKEAYLKARYPENLVHGFFDAISPEINDLHRFDEIKRWLVDLGFRDVRLTLDNRNLHMIADKPASLAG
jgi:SAM-dependent methyltransferase